MKTRILLCNTRGAADLMKKRRMYQEFRLAGADIAIWTEVHVAQRDIDTFTRYFACCDLNCLISPGDGLSCGVVIMWKRSLGDSAVSLSSPNHYNGRLLSTQVTLDDMPPFTLVGVYAPNDDRSRRDFFCSLPWDEWCDSTIIGGDFNCITELGDKSGGNDTRHCSSSVYLKAITYAHQLYDPVIALAKQQEATWCDSHNHIKSRIDRFYCSGDILHSAIDVTTSPHALADHRQVLLTLDFASVERGIGYWKLNSSLLRDANVVRMVRDYINDTSRVVPAGVERLTAVHHISRYVLQQQGEFAAFVRRFELNSKIERLRKLEQSIDDNPADSTSWNDFASLSQQINLEREEQLEALCIRSRIRFRLEGERCNAFYMARAKAQKKATIIKSLNSEDLNKPVEEIAADFYERLFDERRSSYRARRKLLHNVQRKITPEMARALATPLTLKDIEGAIKGMANNKSPGADGLTVEFYKTFCNELAPILLEAWEDANRKGQLPEELRTGIIALLYKKGDRSDIANYRPITLMPVSYKIYSKALANRLAPFMHKLIGEHQTGFIRGRDIRTNIIAAKLGAEFAKKNCEAAGILFFDFEKAFDRLNRSLIWGAMKKLGFPVEFIRWTQLLLRNSKARCLINGFLSRVFDVFSGIRQGCPFSPTGYALGAEPLQATIEAHPKIQGIRISGRSLRASYFADDTTGFPTSQMDIVMLMASIALFESGGGMKLNRKKCRFLCLKGELISPQDIDMLPRGQAEPLLGARLSHDIEDLSTYNDIFVKMESKIQKWTRARPTWIGRAIVAKTSILAHLLYFASVSSTPEYVRRRARTLIDSFIFNRSPHRLSYAVASLPICCGGINAPDVDATIWALKARLMYLWLTNQHALWAQFWAWKLECVKRYLKVESIFSIAPPAWIKDHFGIVGEAIWGWHLMRKTLDLQDLNAAEAESLPLLYNPVIAIPTSLGKKLSAARVMNLGMLLNDDSVWRTRDDLRVKQGLRLSEAEYRSMQTAIPGAMFQTARSPQPALSKNDWLELRTDRYVAPHYIHIEELLPQELQAKVRYFELDHHTIQLRPSDRLTETLLQDDIQARYCPVFVMGDADSGFFLIGPIIDKRYICAQIAESTALLKSTFREMRLAIQPPRTVAIPRKSIENFDYQQAYKWIDSVYDRKLQVFAIQLVTQKVSLCDHTCHLCDLAPSSTKHLFEECSKTVLLRQQIAQKWYEWTAEDALDWSAPLVVTHPKARFWNLVTVCAKRSVYSYYWQAHFDRLDEIHPIAIVRSAFYNLREFLLAASRSSNKTRKLWSFDETWISAQGALNEEALLL